MLTNKAPIVTPRCFLRSNLRQIVHLCSALSPWQSHTKPHLRKYANSSVNHSASIVYYNSQISKHGRKGNVKEAETVFCSMPIKNTVTWTAMLTAYGENGQLANARKVFDEMPERNVASWNAMVTAYVRNNLRVCEAYELFCRMPERNAVSYAAMITGFVHAGLFDVAERLYGDMPVKWRDPVCSNVLLSGYLRMGELDKALMVFEGIVEKDVVSWSSMVDGYCKKGRVTEARKLFDVMPVKNVVSWTAMINGYMKVENFREGFRLFLCMRKEGVVEVNSTTLTVTLEACANLCRTEEGRQLHGLVLRMGHVDEVILCNSIINMYGKCGCLDAATRMFYLMKKKDLVSWNSLLASYIQANRVEEAYDFFQNMPEKDVVSWTTIIGGLSSKGDMEKSISLFEMMPQKDDFAWTAVISGLINNGEFARAIHWYILMNRKAIRPNALTLSSVISASAGLASLMQGLQIHAYAVKMDMEFNLSVQNSLVTMYSKCGDISDAYEIFSNISNPNVVSFNSMITGFSQHGLGQESIKLFKQMQIYGLEPDHVTFLGILSACTHIGLVKEGLAYFESMRSSFCIEPGPDHYACMVDLLSRAGLFNEALDLIQSMPFEPHSGFWGALLNASRSHLRPDLAKLAAEHIFEMEPTNATPYVVLSNIYYALGKKDGERIRLAKGWKGLRKSPGCSWIVVKENVHLFVAGDLSHIDIKEIIATLGSVALNSRKPEFYA